ncbi:6779_t:CDS:10 [Acaulospora morrowiae]|uniref:6779_t:CDS:1 n=1 Tax=Acaulospora morrowiae TaxID=94023 RepID=A0A9N9ALH1_9GLOM|nr:6779_t:CDS:10 [Acaulospora morrowiae]
MHLLPECFKAVRCPAFWESTDEPSLKNFLYFRLSAGELTDVETEYHIYKQELSEISKFYSEISEIGQEVLSGNDCVSVGELYSTNHLGTLSTIEYTNYSTTCAIVVERLRGSKRSSAIKNFWKLQEERQNIMARNKLIEDKVKLQEEKAKARVLKLQTTQHITIATAATEQIQQYATSTTTSIAKRFLDNDNKKTTKRTRNHKDQSDEDDSESDDRDCLTDSENSSTMTHKNQKRARSQSGLLDRNDMRDGNRTLPHQIIGNPLNLDNSQSSNISNSESILKASAKSLANLDEVKYFGELIPLFEKYKEQEKHNIYSCTNDDVMDIRGDSGFAKFLTIDQYTKLLSVRPKRSAVLPECWCRVIEEYYMESLTEGGPKKTITDWVRITDALMVGEDGDTEEVKRLKKYLYRVMLPLIESFLKPIPDINAPDSSEHHYWSEFGHHFFSKALQEFAGLDWRAMDVPVSASKYRKNYGFDHAIHKIVEGNSADLLARSWGTGEEIFVGEQAGPPTKPDLTKLSMDSFKLYRELRDCLNVRILHAMEIGGVNYSNRAVFGILGYLFEIKMLIMWKDGVYVYEEFGSFTVASHSRKIHTMKAGILKLLEFIMVIKAELESNVKVEYDDKVQILKRKFSDIIQTKLSPLKVSKVK